MHPRTKSKMNGIVVPKGIRIIEPLGFYDFNFLNMNAYCLLADSGTTPEEGLFYKIPCVSIRKSTERPETVEAGAHIVAGTDPNNIAESVETAVSMKWNARYDLFEEMSPSYVVYKCVEKSNYKLFLVDL